MILFEISTSIICRFPFSLPTISFCSRAPVFRRVLLIAHQLHFRRLHYRIWMCREVMFHAKETYDSMAAQMWYLDNKHQPGFLCKELSSRRVLGDLFHFDWMSLDPRSKDVVNFCVPRGSLQWAWHSVWSGHLVTSMKEGRTGRFQ